ncbi:MAG TPA: hypothetical protein VLV88_06860 [Terriglobales bacterium]|nr:hypothetical protein [Terriglobales bacterium]
MIRRAFHPTQPHAEPDSGRHSATGEEWLGHNRSEKRRLWERLNPRHRKLLRLLAEALALHQSQGRLSDADRTQLSSTLAELERLGGRVNSLLLRILKHIPRG